MSRILPAICIAMAVCTPSHAADDPNPTEKDILYGVIDPFHLGAQRQAFLRAAGADMDLDQEEFEKDKENGSGFTRSYDTWDAILIFDSNHSRSIDWLEAADYRIKLREILLSIHDLNSNKRLQGDERKEALKAVENVNLAEFIVSRARTVLRSSQPKSDSESTEAPEPLRNPLDDATRDIDPRLKEYDDLSLRIFATEDEPWTSSDDLTRELGTHALFLIQDHDGDGVKTENDWELFGRRLRESRRVDSQRAMERAVEKYDTNGNGRLDLEESAARKRMIWFALERASDLNLDGVLDDEERRLFENNPMYRSIKSIEEFDEDGDGLLNEQEYESYYRNGAMYKTLTSGSPDELGGLYGEYRTEFWWEFDVNNDGKLSADEVEKLNEAFKKDTRGKAPITQYPFNPWDDTDHLLHNKKGN